MCYIHASLFHNRRFLTLRFHLFIWKAERDSRRERAIDTQRVPILLSSSLQIYKTPRTGPDQEFHLGLPWQYQWPSYLSHNRLPAGGRPWAGNGTGAGSGTWSWLKSSSSDIGLCRLLTSMDLKPKWTSFNFISHELLKYPHMHIFSHFPMSMEDLFQDTKIHTSSRALHETMQHLHIHTNPIRIFPQA